MVISNLNLHADILTSALFAKHWACPANQKNFFAYIPGYKVMEGAFDNTSAVLISKRSKNV